MDWQQKASALNHLSQISLRIRSAGDWYIDQSVEVKDDSILKGLYGNGKTPEEAINNHWTALTDLEPHEYLVIRAGDPAHRQAVRWNGHMWQTVSES